MIALADVFEDRMMGKSKLYLSHTDDSLELTREDFAEADCKEPWRYERVKGRLVVMSPAGFEHHVTAKIFRNHLGAYELAHPDTVEHVFQEGWVSVEDDTDRIPDIEVFLKSNTDTRSFPERVPDLIFEIVSEGQKDRDRDYMEKREEYERIGVREYVIVDRFEHAATVFRLIAGGYEETVLGPDDVYTSPLLPGLVIALQGVI